MATEAEEQFEAPQEQATHDVPTNPYPDKQVTATVAEPQVEAPKPQAEQTLELKKYPETQVRITDPEQVAEKFPQAKQFPLLA